MKFTRRITPVTKALYYSGVLFFGLSTGFALAGWLQEAIWYIFAAWINFIIAHMRVMRGL